ncbi:Flp family type IVb pilin [Afifella pfennigii]|uniref:Flp family type IVb pilin n=1 Tax=Afifella pfennigii TaxID=209897 RepID=UPI00047EA05B|nr:hypothetical protein [Afifella pfennigii]
MAERSFTNAARRWAQEEGGATAVEYALVCSIVVAALTAIIATGNATSALYGVLDLISEAIGGSTEGGG